MARMNAARLTPPWQEAHTVEAPVAAMRREIPTVFGPQGVRGIPVTILFQGLC